MNPPICSSCKRKHPSKVGRKWLCGYCSADMKALQADIDRLKAQRKRIRAMQERIAKDPTARKKVYSVAEM